MSQLEKRIEDLEEIIAIQCTDGTWNFNEYHFGLANGLLLALAVMKGDEPKFRLPPDAWLEGQREIANEPL